MRKKTNSINTQTHACASLDNNAIFDTISESTLKKKLLFCSQQGFLDPPMYRGWRKWVGGTQGYNGNAAEAVRRWRGAGVVTVGVYCEKMDAEIEIALSGFIAARTRETDSYFILSSSSFIFFLLLFFSPALALWSL